MTAVTSAEINPHDHCYIAAVLLKPACYFLAGDFATIAFYPYHGVYFIMDGPNWVPIPREYFKLIGNA